MKLVPGLYESPITPAIDVELGKQPGSVPSSDVTLNKDPDHFSPTTLYNDYPISQTRFHWESQSVTRAVAVGTRGSSISHGACCYSSDGRSQRVARRRRTCSLAPFATSRTNPRSRCVSSGI